MKTFIEHLTERGYKNRTIGLIENGSWAPLAAKIMKEMMSKCKKIDWLKNSVHIWSAVKEENRKQIDDMTDELCKEYIAKDDTLANKNDMTALFRIGYANHFKKLYRTLFCLRLRRMVMPYHALHNLCAYGHCGVKRGHRVLEHHCNALSVNRAAHLLF